MSIFFVLVFFYQNITAWPIYVISSLTGSSVGLGPCLTKAEVPSSSLPGGHWGISQFTGKAYLVGSLGPLGDYGDA